MRAIRYIGKSVIVDPPKKKKRTSGINHDRIVYELLDGDPPSGIFEVEIVEVIENRKPVKKAKLKSCRTT